jgi:hypothetical protein
MFKRIRNWFKREAPAAAPATAPAELPRLHAEPDPKVAPGKRVYHEYFVADAAVGNAWPWRARVYTAGGAILEETGHAATRRAACQAAITWAERKKASVRKGME